MSEELKKNSGVEGVDDQNEELESSERREFNKNLLKGVGTAALVAGVGTPLLSDEAEARSRWDRWDARSVHEARDRTVPFEKLLELDVPAPRGEEVTEMLGGENTGIIMNQRYHRMWTYKDGELDETFVISTGRKDASKGINDLHGKLRYIGKQIADYKSRKYNNSPMPSSSFLSKTKGKLDDDGIAMHGSYRISFNEKTRRWEVHLDVSGGCINMKGSNAKYVFDNFREGTPVYTMTRDQEELDGDMETETSLLESISLAEEEIYEKFFADIKRYREKHVKYIKDLLPTLPNADNIASQHIRNGVYGEYEHGQLYSELNPVFRRLSKSGVHSNGIRVGNKLVTVINGSVRKVNLPRRGSEADKNFHYSYLKNFSIPNMSNKSLNGVWASFFGYEGDDEDGRSHKRDGIKWNEIYGAGLLAYNKETGGLVIITELADIVDEGTLASARIDGEFTFVGLIKNTKKVGDGLYAHFLIGPDELRNSL